MDEMVKTELTLNPFKELNKRVYRTVAADQGVNPSLVIGVWQINCEKAL